MALITRLSKIEYIRTKLVYCQMHGFRFESQSLPRMTVCCECCVLLGRDLCDGTISGRGESYRVCAHEHACMSVFECVVCACVYCVSVCVCE